MDSQGERPAGLQMPVPSAPTPDQTAYEGKLCMATWPQRVDIQETWTLRLDAQDAKLRTAQKDKQPLPPRKADG